jgi:phage terminase large subunit GpA-like protein
MGRVCAYAWARRNVLAVKGVAGRRPVIVRSKVGASGSPTRKGRLWIAGVDEVKALLLARLSRNPDTTRFSGSLPLVWFEQLTAERRVVRRIGGRPVRRFERITGRAAEALDGTVYALAARQVLGPLDFEDRTQQLKGKTPAPRPAPPSRQVIRSSYMTRDSQAPWIMRGVRSPYMGQG